MLDKHSKGDDYLFVFDFHDDLLLLDSENDPSSIEFFQVKTKRSGNWTLHSLLKRKKGKDGALLNSHLGKMYDCKLNFPDQTKAINFVSNALYKVKLAKKDEVSTDKSLICTDQLDTQEIEQIKLNLKLEHKLNSDPDFESITFFRVAELSHEDHSTHAKGKLSEFLENLNPSGKYRIGVVYRILFDEVKRRTNYSYDLQTFDELLEHKSIGRSFMKKIIEQTEVVKDYDQIWKSIESRLNSEHLPPMLIMDFRDQWKKLEVERMQPTNEILRQALKDVSKITDDLKFEGKLDDKGILECADLIFEVFHKNNPDLPFEEAYIKTIALSKIYE